jgi:hypothetical protein
LNNQTRPIPKKTVVAIAIIIVLGIAFYFINESGKSLKATKVLAKIGYKNINNISVAKITKFNNEETNIQGYRYTVKFHNIDTNENCRGFMWADFKKNIIHDIDCGI